MELRQSDLKFVYSRIPQDVRRFMVEGRGRFPARTFSPGERRGWDEHSGCIEE